MILCVEIYIIIFFVVNLPNDSLCGDLHNDSLCGVSMLPRGEFGRCIFFVFSFGIWKNIFWICVFSQVSATKSVRKRERELQRELRASRSSLWGVFFNVFKCFRFAFVLKKRFYLQKECKSIHYRVHVLSHVWVIFVIDSKIVYKKQKNVKWSCQNYCKRDGEFIEVSLFLERKWQMKSRSRSTTESWQVFDKS